MTILVFGKNGRFAKGFIDQLNPFHDFIEISFNDFFETGLASIKEEFKRKEITAVVWTYGAGTSRVANKSLEIDALNKFELEIQRTNLVADKMIFLSSGGSLYGLNPGEVDETSPIQPVGIHGYIKAECENIVVEKISSHFRSIDILRIPNAYSLLSEESRGGLIDLMHYSIKTSNIVTINVDLLSRRQYASHLDYVSYISKWYLEKSSIDVGINIENIVGPETLSISEIIETFDNIYPNKLKIGIENGPESTVILKSQKKLNRFHRWCTLKERLLSTSKFG